MFFTKKNFYKKTQDTRLKIELLMIALISQQCTLHSRALHVYFFVEKKQKYAGKMTTLCLTFITTYMNAQGILFELNFIVGQKIYYSTKT